MLFFLGPRYEAGQCGEDVNTQHKNNLQAIQDAVNFRAWNGVQIKWGAGNTSLRRMQQNAFQGLKGIMLRGHPYTDKNASDCSSELGRLRGSRRGLGGEIFTVQTPSKHSPGPSQFQGTRRGPKRVREDESL